jgi:hypothetical protein
VSYISIGHIWQIYPYLGVETDYHNVCHDGFNDAASRGPRLDRQSAAAAYRKIARWHMEMVAKLLGYLKENDGTGSLLDQSVFVATTEFGDGGLHYDSYVPFIVAGKAGRGADGMKTGFNHQFRCEFGEGFKNASWCATKPPPANRAINDVWQSALMALGVLGPNEKFGDPTLPTRPLEGLWV